MTPRARKNNHRAIRRPAAASRESNSHLIADRGAHLMIGIHARGSACKLNNPGDLQKGSRRVWLRGLDLNQRPLGYEPNELPDCSTPRFDDNNRIRERQTRQTPVAHQAGTTLTSRYSLS